MADEASSAQDAEAAAARAQYRSALLHLCNKSQDAYDKAVLALSAGALGVSVAVVKDIAGGQTAKCIVLVILAWGCWLLSAGCTLFSFASAKSALRSAVDRLDQGTFDHTRPGGLAGQITTVLNVTAGALFGVGALLFVVFASINLGRP